MQLKSNLNNSSLFCLIGASFETSNMGVSALAAGTIESIINSQPNAEIIFLDYGIEGKTYQFKSSKGNVPVRLLNIRFSKKFYLTNNIAYLIFLALLLKIIPIKTFKHFIIRRNAWFHDICRADVVTSIAGGDSFSDIYGFGRLVYVALPQILVLLLNKKLILLPQTYGPFSGCAARAIARFILNRSYEIYSRDQEGLAEVAQLSGKEITEKLHFCHDVGFVVAPDRPSHSSFDKLAIPDDKTGNLVGLNVSGLLFMGGYTKKNMFGLKSNYADLIYDLIHYLITVKSVPVLLVPHVFGSGTNSESDSSVCKLIYRELKPRYLKMLFMASGHFNQSEIKYIIGQCDFFIGARMHACIGALSQCIPAIGIAYSKKFKGVFETVGMESLVADPRLSDKDEILRIIDTAYDNRVQLRNILKQRIPKARQNVFDIFKNMDFKMRSNI